MRGEERHSVMPSLSASLFVKFWVVVPLAIQTGLSGWLRWRTQGVALIAETSMSASPRHLIHGLAGAFKPIFRGSEITDSHLQKDHWFAVRKWPDWSEKWCP